MRLRPSGNQGPVATSSVASFPQVTSRTEAWTWEHLALTRARPIAGDAGLMDEVEAFRREVVAGARDAAELCRDVADMRDRIAAAKVPDGPWDAKIGAGRLQDVELLSQAGALMAGSERRSVGEGLKAGVAIGWLNAAEAGELDHAYGLFWQVQLASKLLSGRDHQARGDRGGRTGVPAAGNRRRKPGRAGCGNGRARRTGGRDHRCGPGAAGGDRSVR